MKIKRLPSLFILSAVLVSGSLLFVISQKVQSTERDIKALEVQIARENETVRVLQAEWAYLNRPDRLESLAANTQLEPTAIPQSLNETIVLQEVIVPIPVRKPVFNIMPQSQIIEASTGEQNKAENIQPSAQDSDEDTGFQSLIDNLEKGAE